MRWLRYLLALSLLLFAVSCKKPETGAAKVHWDRDFCELCRMMLSDRHFTAQVRGGKDRRAWKFDDIGCALHYANDRKWLEDSSTEIWITQYNTGRGEVVWLDAKKAFWVKGLTTPMDFGFGAVPNRVEGAVTYEEMKREVLLMSPEERQAEYSRRAEEVRALREKEKASEGK